ncbi:P-loop containing nucleoside triphosphate hydrolase protein, partial [Mycena alexandri]
MPSSKLDAQRDKLVDYGIAACHALQGVGDGQNIPFLQTAAGISQLIMGSIQRVRANKSQCIQLIDQVHEILCVLFNLCGGFEASLSLALLHNISQFIETLQKVHVYVRAQADLGIFKRIVKQTEHASQFGECTAGLKQALESFGVSTQISFSSSLFAIATATDKSLHRRNNCSDPHGCRAKTRGTHGLVAQMNDAASTRSYNRTALHRSSSSLSLLPGSPKIFYGREQEVVKIVAALTASNPARVAILGPGGMGKTCLALAAVHNTEIVTMFGNQRFFIPLSAAVSATDLIAKVAQYFGLEQHGRLQKNILRHLCAAPAPVLLVLDNMEDCWELLAGRPQVEDFLSHLSDVPGLRLLVTMRGVERPNQVKWSRPFLLALIPLDADAARSTFVDITDEVADEKIANKLLALTDHLPLAISLMANLASFDGCNTVLERWNSETTSLLSDGADKLSNLDTSIMISLTSPRMKSNPNALKVLSLMALLPDGVSRADLEEMNLPLADVARCISTLMRCALCYLDSDHRFKLLAPIAQFTRRQYPIFEELQCPLREHFYNVANLFTVPDFLSPSLVHRLSSDLGNIRSMVLYSLGSTDHKQLVQTFGCIIKLAGFTYLTNLGSLEGLDSLDEVVAKLDEPRLEGQYLYIMSYFNHAKMESSNLRALQCFERAEDLVKQAMAYRALGFYYQMKRDAAKP